MPDFLDRFGDQLQAAHAATLEGTRMRVAPRSRRVRRPAIAAVVLLAVAAPALAVVNPWSPVVGRPGIDGSVATSRAPVADAAVQVLGVLRRPQTAEDQAIAATKLTAIGTQISDVQTDAIRALKDGWVLVPAKTVTTGPPDQTSSDQLCITNGVAVGCSPAASAQKTGVGIVGASATETKLAGLVPDGVARVRFTRTDGSAVESDVASNFYDLTVPEVATPTLVTAPPGSKGPSTIPGPPRPAGGTVSWLSSTGQVIGPDPSATPAG